MGHLLGGRKRAVGIEVKDGRFDALLHQVGVDGDGDSRAGGGSPVQVLDSDLDGLRRKAGPKAKVGRDFWSAVRRDAILLIGSQLDDLIDSVR